MMVHFLLRNTEPWCHNVRGHEKQKVVTRSIHVDVQLTNVYSCLFSTWSFHCTTAAKIQLAIKEQKVYVNICVLTYNVDPFHSTLRCLCYLLCDDYINVFVASSEIFLAISTLFSVTVRTTLWV